MGRVFNYNFDESIVLISMTYWEVYINNRLPGFMDNEKIMCQGLSMKTVTYYSTAISNGISEETVSRVVVCICLLCVKFYTSLDYSEGGKLWVYNVIRYHFLILKNFLNMSFCYDYH